jgi:hypothetical protein
LIPGFVYDKGGRQRKVPRAANIRPIGHRSGAPAGRRLPNWPKLQPCKELLCILIRASGSGKQGKMYRSPAIASIRIARPPRPKELSPRWPHAGYFGTPARSALIRPPRGRKKNDRPPEFRNSVANFAARMPPRSVFNYAVGLGLVRSWLLSVASSSGDPDGWLPETTSTSASSSRGKTSRRSSSSRSPSMRPMTGRGAVDSRR